MYNVALLGHILAKSSVPETGADGWQVSTIGRYQEDMWCDIGSIAGLACVAAKHARR